MAATRTLVRPAPQNPRLTVPEVDIRICLGTGGVAAGSREVLKAFEEELARQDVLAVIRPREDKCEGRTVSVTGTGCQGLCAMDPLVEIHLRRNGKSSKVTYGLVTPAMVPEIIEKHILGGEVIKKWLVLTDEGPTEYNPFYDAQEKLTLRHVGIIDPEDIDDYLEAGGYQALYKVLSEMTPAEVIDEIKRSGLRGRGGAGFPTGQKWEFAAGYQSPDGVKYFICNGDEGDPGAFMDCSALEGEPHAVFEGMAIGAYAIGASVGYMYVRAEYPLALRRIKIGLEVAEERGLLGDNIMGSDFSFHIKLKEGAGAFVCGEETALMQSIEGDRGMPRLRPPFPAESGLWRRPTNINNVETLAVVPWIITNGAAAFAARGYENSKGTKVFALAGKVNRTGLAEVPMGMTLREVIFGIGGGVKKGKKFKAVQMGGPSGGCLPESLLDLPVDYETINKTGAIVGSGGMIVIDEDNCIVDTARYFLSFTQSESCGKCPPCRIGTKRMLDLLTKICEGKGTLADLDFLEKMAEQVKIGSLCALGGTAPNPVFTALKYFRDEFEEHVVDKRCRAGICTALVTYSIDPEACTGCRACVRVCPTEAITGERKEAHVIDNELCIKCGACYEKCRFDAVRRS
ncbi:MAG: NADH-quinone oxidoreductase subunit NuoF [Actinobacteria bacterium]|jgi:NADH-quinone oxidoreductase subunit F|nr:NADH-quinone oxidoreductase subunit NuoF [Actinomycetota bacterium]